MRIYAWKELSWEDNKLMLGKEEQCRLVPYQSKWSKTYIGYKIKWPNGDTTKDHYNRTWAKETAHAYTLSRLNSQETPTVGSPIDKKQIEVWISPRFKKSHEALVS